MNNNINEEMKLKFISLICRGDGRLDHDIEKDEDLYNNYLISKENIDAFFENICNSNIKSTNLLDETELYILRKRLGFFDFGHVQTFKTISENMNMSPKKVSHLLDEIRSKLFYYRWETSKRRDETSEFETSLGARLSDFRNSEHKVFMPELFHNDVWSVEKKTITETDVIKELIYQLEIDEKYYDFIKQIVDKLYDLKSDSVLNLSAKETFIIRKRLGILDGGIKQFAPEISQTLKCDKYMCYNSIFDGLFKYVNTHIYNETMKLSGKDGMLSLSLQRFDLNGYTFKFHHNNIWTLKDLICYSNKKSASYGYMVYDSYLVKILFDLIEEGICTNEELGLTKERLEEFKKREKAVMKADEKRLNNIARYRKEIKELEETRNALLAEIRKKEEKIKRLENK